MLPEFSHGGHVTRNERLLLAGWCARLAGLGARLVHQIDAIPGYGPFLDVIF